VNTLAQRREFAAHERPVTAQELVDRAKALRPLVRERQEESESLGTYAPDLHERFVEAGFFRITEPRMFGGYEFDLPVFFGTMLEICRADPGAGWCLTLGASHAWTVASHWPEEAQRALFGPDGHFVAPHRPVPMGTLRKVKDGYIVNGQWNYCSGIPYATHFLGGAFLEGGDGPPQQFQFAVPKGGYEMLNDWGGDAMLGMRASGSNSVKITDTFIPEYLAIPAAGLLARPEDMVDGTPGTRLHGNPMYLGRMMGPYHCSLALTVIGAALAAIDEYEELMTTQRVIFDPTMLRVDHFDHQRPFGNAIAMTDAAQSILFGAAQKYLDYCYEWQETGRLISIEDNIRLWAEVQQAGRLACEAVELLYQTSGSSTSRKGARLARYFRDVAMYRSHVSAQYLNFATYVARAHFGKPMGMLGI
jgi:3-hydroxy-9,10-secoandrosta-1,3,5(10)-triene-9,17-dione monooxygenase